MNLAVLSDNLSAWGTARKMLEVYGQEASLVAAERRAHAATSGDKMTSARWGKIAALIGKIRANDVAMELG